MVAAGHPGETIGRMDEMSLANKLAALALAVTEAMLSGVEDLAPSAIAALISIREGDPMSIGEIAAVVGLTHSAAVRLVDRLEKEWLVRRQRRVGREVMVEITSRGRRRAQQLQENRLAAMARVLAPLSGEERAALDGLVDRVIGGIAPATVPAARFCRMCRRDGCDCGLHDHAEA